MADQHDADVEYLASLLERYEDLGPKPERFTEEYVDQRVQRYADRFDSERQKAGIWSINERLREHDVPPGVRLHLVSAVAHLSRLAEESREERTARAR